MIGDFTFFGSIARNFRFDLAVFAQIAYEYRLDLRIKVAGVPHFLRRLADFE